LDNKALTESEKIEVRAFLLDGPAIWVKEGAIKADGNGSAISNAQAWAREHSEEIVRPDIGRIVFDQGGVRDSLSHKFGRMKLDAVQAIPSAIKSGKVVSISDDFGGKPMKNVVLVAPIQIGGNERSFLCVRLVRNVGDDSRLRIHEVFDMGDVKNTAIPFQTPGTDQTARPQRGIAIYISILRDVFGVNG